MLLVATTVLLSGCTKFWKKSESTPQASSSAAGRTMNLYIWAEYTSPTLLEAFEKKTGIKVVESNFASNEEMLAKLQAGVTGYDVIVPSDYMVAVMIKLGMLAPLDKDKIPNSKNLDPKLLGKPYDPENRYSLPYSWSTTGIAVNRLLYKNPVDGWSAVFSDPAAAGRVSMLDDVREVVGAALKFQGHTLNSRSDKELAEAKDLLMKSKGRFKAFNSTPVDLISSGEIFLAQMYSGEALVAARDSGKPIEFVIPKEGATIAIENVVIPNSSTRKPEATEFINFLFEESSNIDFVTRVLSGPVVAGIREKLPADVAGNPGLFPDEATLKNCEMMEDLGDFTAAYDRIWSEFKAAGH
jgi:spermidine/putrescine transport system substrate-binding protein